MTVFSKQVISVIQSIPRGKVMTYGQIAGCAGSSGAARQVARLLHSCSKKYALPWHRVVGAGGRISLGLERGGALQIELLKKEGVKFSAKDRVNMDQHLLVEW